MKTTLKKILVILAVILTASFVTNFVHEAPVSAASSGDNCRFFLGMTSWDCHINESWNGESVLKSNIWIIVSNVANDIAVVAAYLVLGYVIYGGYQYIFASGDVSKTLSGKKTLFHAFIGLAIVMLAKVIMNAIHFALIGSNGAFSGTCMLDGVGCVEPSDLIANIISWVIGTAGVVCAIYVILGAVGYVTSAGDPGKLKKAKETIIYSLIGLTIVGLSLGITAFVTNLIKNSNKNETSLITTTKELKA